MYYFSLFACLGVVGAAISFLKYLDLSSILTMTLGIATMLLGVFGIAWFSAKDSEAEAAKNSDSAAIAAKKTARTQTV